MKIYQKYELVFDRILTTKAAPRVLFGSPWSLPKRLRKRLRSRHSFLNLKYISVIANSTFAFMQKPSNHMCFTVFFTHATFFRRLLTCKQEVAKMDKFLCQNWSKIVKKINIWSKSNLESFSHSIFNQNFQFGVLFLTSFWNPKSLPKHPKWLCPLTEVPGMSTMPRKASYDAPKVSQRALQLVSKTPHNVLRQSV